MRRYNPKEIEPKWQKVWEDTGIYKVDMSKTKDKFYTIPMLPYPSGDLHIGHWYNYTGADTIARWRKMMGQNVMSTMGFDAFGLPAENAAIRNNIPPAKWTRGNIGDMKKQMGKIGAAYDWSNTITTCDPGYYKWNQWLFLELYKRKLAYRAKSVVNWCPKDQTVLANEQVVGDDNACERCGTPVVQKEMEQWFFKITDYAERLLKDLDQMDWPQRVKTMQANWIGKSQGALINFGIENSKDKIKIFTTRPDTIYGATYIVLAPEHPLAKKVATNSQQSEVDAYAAATLRKTELERKATEKEKTGIFSGSYAINPATKEKIPIWMADYVLMGYGTGAIMAVPAHDERDYEFAKSHELQIRQVIEPETATKDTFYTGEGKLVDSGNYTGLNSASARDKMANEFGKEQTQYRLRDWLISRQRYWGTPIPVVYCDKCGIQTVDEKNLPVILPEDVEFTPAGRNPLLDRADFVDTKCPSCSGPAKRETDTMDTFVDSSWYFLRYLDNKNNNKIFDNYIVNKWGPVDHYLGGIEHAILHLMYARFITMFLYDYHNLTFEEPFTRLTNQGIILGPDGYKMSKSRGNVVSPDEQVISYGADSLRLYLMFMGPYEQGGPYNLSGIAGTRRFLERVWALVFEFKAAKDKSGHNSELAVQIERVVQKATKKVTKDIEYLGFNTAIAALMECVNELYRIKSPHNFALARNTWEEALISLIQMIAPFAPHIAEELWAELGQSGSVHISKWPSWDESLITDETITLVVQINGKVRAEILTPADIGEAEAIQLAKSDVRVLEYLTGKEIKKAIYVPGRLVSLVI